MNIKETADKLKSNKNVLWGILVIIIIVILILVGGKKEKDETLIDEENNGEEVILDEDGNVVSTPTSPTQTITSDGYEYAFSGVEWIFDTEDEQVIGTGNTYLKMMFADFTRNGNAISFGRPYKLGFHPGTCSSIDFLDTTEVSGIPIAYARCSDGTTTREFAVLQNMEEVIIEMRETSDENLVWQEWYKINVTEIVR